jgi:hypothetical protein
MILYKRRGVVNDNGWTVDCGTNDWLDRLDLCLLRPALPATDTGGGPRVRV